MKPFTHLLSWVTPVVIPFKLSVDPRKAALLIAGLLLFAAPSALATTYYVDSQGGNDGYDGLAPSHQGRANGPWKTLAKVNITTFAPGDSILFKRGGVWFDGPLEPVNGGAPGGTITIAEAILGQPFSFELPDPANNNCIYFGAYAEGAKPKIDCQGGRGIILWHNYIIVEGLHLDNGDNNVLWLANSDGNYWNILKDIDVTNSASNAVRSSFGGGNLWFKGLYVYNYGTNGILLNGSVNNKLKGVLVEDCWVENPQTQDLEDGITCHRDATGNDLEGDVIIRNNTILYAGEDGIDITSGHNILVAGNDIRHSYGAGIYVVKDWVHTVEVRGNFLSSNTISQGVGEMVIEVPNVWAVNNVITGTGHHCLHLGSLDNVKIWNNVVAPGNRTGNLIWLRDSIGQLEFRNNIFDFSRTDQDISGDITSNISFDYNCYFGSSTSQDIVGSNSFEAERSANPLFEPNGFWANPQFAGPEYSEAVHFQLMDVSRCIDRGVSVALPVDFWGVPRPQNSRFDIGIYERGTLDCDPDPNVTAYPGTACDDGDPLTINDAYDDNCNCAGEPGPCTDIGDNDGDGVCADVDCDDNDPSINFQVGDACDDNDPSTSGDVIQGDCNCAGVITGPLSTCSRVNASSDDAEERTSGDISQTSSDLEMANDPSNGDQVVGMRFTGLNIPQGATIVSAHIQFAADETTNVNPCQLAIYGQDSDDAATFTNDDFDITNRPRTAASVTWEPAEWLIRGYAGADERTTDISAVIQEIINRSGYAAGNAIAIFIDGAGQRTAESFDGSPATAPELCVEYETAPDCPGLNANIGDVCDDGDNTTTNDTVDSNCNCIGTPTACTGIGDADGDGICSDVDCNDNDPGITTQPGDACDDGNNNTINDSIDNDCNCTGSPTSCPDTGDNDGDGICADVDCNDNDPGITTQPGDACDDGDNTTTNDVIDSNCNCTGAPTACTGIGDADGDGVCADVDCDDNNPNITTQDADGDGICSDVDCNDNNANIAYQPGDACSDGDNTTLNDTIDDSCNCTGTPTACTGYGDNDADGVCSDVDCDDNNPAVTSQDADNDGICSDVDCDDNDPSIAYQPGDACDDGDNTTINDAIDNNCNCTGTSTACTGIGDSDADGVCSDVDCDDNNPNVTTQDADNDGICSDVDCDDNDPSIAYQPGDACNDGDNTTLNDAIDNNCNCTGTSTACTGIGDSDADGVCADVDCDDNNPNVTSQDADGDGICSDVDCDDNDPSIAYQPGDACNDGDNTTLNDAIDNNCNCTGTSTACTGIGDSDADGVCSDVDCDDNNPNVTTQDADNDGICSDVDCDDNDPSIAYQPGDACNDGDNTTLNDAIDNNCNCTGTSTACTGIGDNDADGVCADVDCDDNNPNVTTQDADNDGICSDVDCDDNDASITYQPGDACDDGDPSTIGETIQGDCSCGGGTTPSQACSQIRHRHDDAEERGDGAVLTADDDLELAEHYNFGSQLIGLRFRDLSGVPPGATITNAYLQFTSASADNVSPCNLTIYGEASDNAGKFKWREFYNISDRPRTNAFVQWAPPEWPSAGLAGADQQTPDISTIIQEIVNRGGYSPNNSVVLLIEGYGRRTAKSYNASSSEAPELCVDYIEGANAANLTDSYGGTPAVSAPDEEPHPVLAGEYLISPLSIYPNPATDRLMISFSSAAETRVRLQATGIDGKIILREERAAVPGRNTITLDGLSLPSGLYFLQLFAEDTVQSAKFLIVSD